MGNISYFHLEPFNGYLFYLFNFQDPFISPKKNSSDYRTYGTQRSSWTHGFNAKIGSIFYYPLLVFMKNVFVTKFDTPYCPNLIVPDPNWLDLSWLDLTNPGLSWAFLTSLGLFQLDLFQSTCPEWTSQLDMYYVDLPQLDHLTSADLTCLEVISPNLTCPILICPKLTCSKLTCPELTCTDLTCHRYLPNTSWTPPDTHQTPSSQHPDTI